jgi:hypothetical protein
MKKEKEVGGRRGRLRLLAISCSVGSERPGKRMKEGERSERERGRKKREGGRGGLQCSRHCPVRTALQPSVS